MLARSAQMFPKLTPAQIERIARDRHSAARSRAGEVLFDVGEQNTRFFVVLRGRDRGRAPGRRSRGAGRRARPGRVHRRDQHALGAAQPGPRRASPATARSSPSTATDLRALVQRDSELSEILHARLHPAPRGAACAQATTTWSCSARATRASTLRIREFLSRNGQPFTYQDVETDPGVQALLDRFHVGVDEVPVVVCQRRPRPQEPVASSCWRRRSA